MRRAVAMCPFVLAVVLTLAGCGGDETASKKSAGAAPPRSFSLEEARQFRDFELYALDESYGELPLTAVLRRFDAPSDMQPVRANYVDFIYGSCDASDGGCAPPLSVQVWAACERNPLAYGPDAGEPVTVRSVPAFFHEGGRRLELSTGASTVVIFASGREAALAAAQALQGVNNPVTAGQPLPPPAYTRSEGGLVSVIPCAYDDPTQQIDQDPGQAALVEDALNRELEAGAAREDNQPVREVDCFRSPVPARAGALTDAHECMIAWEDGSFVVWCVLSGENEVLRGTVPGSCKEAASGDSSFVPAVDPNSEPGERWGAHADFACRPWREEEMETIAQFDQDLLYEDLSYMWFALRPYEAAIVGQLRVIPGRTDAAAEAVAMYVERVASIDSGLNAWRRGDHDAALAHFDRAESLSSPLSQLFESLQAGACSPI
jgi:hypothetical protein